MQKFLREFSIAVQDCTAASYAPSCERLRLLFRSFKGRGASPRAVHRRRLSAHPTATLPLRARMLAALPCITFS